MMTSALKKVRDRFPNLNDSATASVVYVGGMVASSGLALLLIPIITAELPAAEYGSFLLAQTYAFIFSGVANLGVSVGYERDFFLYEEDEALTARLLTTCVGFVSICLGLLSFVTWLFDGELARLILDDAGLADIILLCVAGAAVSSLCNFGYIFLKNRGMAKGFVAITVSQALLNFVVTFFLLREGFGMHALAFAFVLSNSFSLIVLILLFSYSLRPSLSGVMLLNVLKISLPLTPRIFFGFLNTHFDKMMLGMVGATGGVAIYSVGHKVASLIYMFMNALDRVFKPEVYRRLFNPDADSASFIGDYLLPFLFVCFLVSVSSTVIVSTLFDWILPPDYRQASLVVIILNVYFLSMFFGKITGTQLIFAKKTWLVSILTFVGITLNVGLNIPLIYLYGLVGAACATLCAGALHNYICFLYAQKYAKITWPLKPLFFFSMSHLLISALMIFDFLYPLDIRLSLMLKILCVGLFVLLGASYGISLKSLLKKTHI